MINANEKRLINYPPNLKRFDMNRKPRRQPLWTLLLIRIVSGLLLLKKKYKIVKNDMKGVKPPFLMLCNHNQFMDFEVAAMAVWPRRQNNIASIEAFNIQPRLIRHLGTIAKRKFTRGISTVKNIMHALKKNRSIVSLYPEARYGAAGAAADLPAALGKMIKMGGCPVVTLIFHGHHLERPSWTYMKSRKVKTTAVMTYLLSAEDVQKMSAAEIQAAVEKAFYYNDYEYQLENNIQITEPYRAEGLHRMLYKCPKCGAEFKMASAGAELSCGACGKAWTLKPDGRLEGNDGATEFETIPEWYEWERTEVAKEIREGTYSFTQEMTLKSMPNPKKFIGLGRAVFTHGMNGFRATGHYNGEDFTIIKRPLENYAVHVEYNFPYLKKRDVISFSTDDDTFFFLPDNSDSLQKVALATEELYKFCYGKN